jgi:protein involved in polysaccharide export with SLBB domain
MTRFTQWIQVIALALGLSASANAVGAAESPTDSEQRPAGQGLSSGDAVQLASWREADLSGTYSVDERGIVVLPIVGPQTVAGIPPAQLKTNLREAYDRHLRNSDLQIMILRRVRVLGAVRNPGLYHIDPTMTIGDAVALAGGATTEGVMKKVQILRDGETAMRDLDSASLIGEQLHSGDQIFVPERPWVVRYGSSLASALIGAAGFILGVR